jgi:hypothetical protein
MCAVTGRNRNAATVGGGPATEHRVIVAGVTATLTRRVTEHSARRKPAMSRPSPLSRVSQPVLGPYLVVGDLVGKSARELIAFRPQKERALVDRVLVAPLSPSGLSPGETVRADLAGWPFLLVRSVRRHRRPPFLHGGGNVLPRSQCTRAPGRFHPRLSDPAHAGGASWVMPSQADPDARMGLRQGD